MTDAERIEALVALTWEILEDFHSDPRSPYDLVSRLRRDQHIAYSNRLSALERGDPQ